MKRLDARSLKAAGIHPVAQVLEDVFRLRPSRLVLAVAMAAAVPAASRAAPTVACHCYQDRTFDPERPAAADPYILATARSSLLSAAFGVDKRSLVSAAMTGTAAEDLWVAHHAGARTGRPAAALLALLLERGNWAAALSGLPGLDASFAAALAGGADRRALASLAVDDVLVSRLYAAPAAVRSLRHAGATPEERILASALAVHLSTPTAPLVAHVRAGKASWGEVLRDAGLSPRDLDGLIRRLVGKKLAPGDGRTRNWPASICR
ncbi:MAG: hypothetical protein NDI82_04545 [Anaeromyxobacteraceae bacterium]|nr:hypothetical protein [Anaeromyxobacteraceae bacterium]